MDINGPFHSNSPKESQTMQLEESSKYCLFQKEVEKEYVGPQD
jgi:hypothetical protein